MTNLPSKPDILDANISTGVWKTYYGNIRDFIYQMLGGAAIQQLVLSNNTIFPRTGINEITLEDGLTKGTVNTIDINNLPNGSVIILSVMSSGVSVTLRNNFGGQGSLVLFNNEDVVLNSGFSVFLTRSGSRWVQMNFAGYMFDTQGIIDNKYLTSASYDNKGIIQVATEEEVVAGAVNNKAVVPVTLQRKIDDSLKVIKPQSLYQGLNVVGAGGVIALEDNIAIYQNTVTKAMNYIFNVDKLTKPYSVITFELHLKMTTPFALTFPATVTWAYGEAPDMSEGGQYLLVFRSFDGGASWIGSLEVRW